MNAFTVSAHARTILEGFFRQESANDGNMFAGSGLVLGYTLSDPPLRIVLDASKPARPGQTFDVYVDDAAAPQPVVEFFMDATTFDKLYRGEAQPMALMMTGKVKSKGDVTAAMRLLPAMARSIPHYKAYRETH